MGFGPPVWAAGMVGGIALLLVMSGSQRRSAITLTAALLIPILTIMLLGREVLSRHWVVLLPLALTLGGSGLGLAYAWLARREPRTAHAIGIAAAAALLIPFVSFWWTAARTPDALPLPADAREQHITQHPAGYGLREAVHWLDTHAERGAVVIASLFPDSCRRANFYARTVSMVCTDAPGIGIIETELAQRGLVYVVADTAPLIGADIAQLAADGRLRAELLVTFPRPGGESQVLVWRVTPV
jgi:hypothetical protein